MSKYLRFNHGHGGKDCGATGNGKYERDEVKKFVLELVKYLKANYTGMEIHYGAEKDSSGHFYGTKAYGTESGGYYSFHMNAANKKAKGTECFYYKYGTARAQKVNDALDNFFTDRGIKYGDRDGDGYGDYYILRECGFDTIVELCFIDSKKDMDILNHNYDRIVKAVGDAIADVEDLKKKSSSKPKKYHKTYSKAVRITSKDSKYLPVNGKNWYQYYIKETRFIYEASTKKYKGSKFKPGDKVYAYYGGKLPNGDQFAYFVSNMKLYYFITSEYK